MRIFCRSPRSISNWASYISVCILSVSTAPSAFAEIGVDLKLGGGKPELEIQDNINSESPSVDESSGSGPSTTSGDDIQTESVSDNSDSGSGSSSNDRGYDPCYIHPDCTAGVGYSSDQKNSMGVGWYCKDGKSVNKNTSFDKCSIIKGCTSDNNYVGYVSSSQSWQCLEKAYIHQGCSSTPGFSDQGSLGAGWYCSDKKAVSQKTKFDPAAINAGCSKKGSGVKFSNGFWQCN